MRIHIALPDALIAASATRVGAAIATANIDDFPMVGVAIEHWPIGGGPGRVDY